MLEIFFIGGVLTELCLYITTLMFWSHLSLAMFDLTSDLVASSQARDLFFKLDQFLLVSFSLLAHLKFFPVNLNNNEQTKNLEIGYNN